MQCSSLGGLSLVLAVWPQASDLASISFRSLSCKIEALTVHSPGPLVTWEKCVMLSISGAQEGPAATGAVVTVTIDRSDFRCWFLHAFPRCRVAPWGPFPKGQHTVDPFFSSAAFWQPHGGGLRTHGYFVAWASRRFVISKDNGTVLHQCFQYIWKVNVLIHRSAVKGSPTSGTGPWAQAPGSPALPLTRFHEQGWDKGWVGFSVLK